MYKNGVYPARVLIIKTSSLGDIIQAFSVLNDLKKRYPKILIDWVVEASYFSVVAAHPLVHRAISISRGAFWASLKNLRKEKYDLVFDLQGNCKSGVYTLFSRGKVKVGYGFRSVREWPNLLATQVRYSVSKNQNIRLFYLQLLERYFREKSTLDTEGVCFSLGSGEKEKISQILAPVCNSFKIMVCPGSKWVNKQLPLGTLTAFLQRVEKEYDASFLLVWGTEREKADCDQIKTHLQNAYLVDRLAIPTWQNLMNEVDLVIAVDSSALHLCATTSTPSFSIFGPTSSSVFKPTGSHHLAIQGKCPYGRSFEKQCPVLRTCPTGSCIRSLSPDELFSAFTEWRKEK